MKDVTLNQREQARLQVLNSVLQYHGVCKFAGEPRHIPQPFGPAHFSRAMQELGIKQVFAFSPQAKGRVKRMAGTFQDRLVSELRLAGARTIQQASAVPREFLPHFNAQFRVPAQQPVVAYLSLDPSLSLKRILCFKHLRQVSGTIRSSARAHPAVASR